MGCSVVEAQARISSQEYTEWLAYYQIDPWGEERSDLRNAMLAMLLANQYRSKGRRAFKIEDFIPKFGRERKRQTAEEAKRVLMAFTAASQGYYGQHR